ncbi:MAG: hypothetical protein FWF92_01060 [Oscillospiraceae bacterium]|nr:hypothetical protein [Oscillospiraceae bacterium]
METNTVLYEYIVEKYGDVVNFSNTCGISLIDLNAVLLKDNISTEICMGLNLCEVLNIDIETMVFDYQVKDSGHEKPACIIEKFNKFIKFDETAVKLDIYKKCMRLSEIEKKKVLEYICSLEY